MISYSYAKDVTDDLAASSTELDFNNKRAAQDDNSYNFIPTGLILKPASPGTFGHQTIICKLYAKNDPVTLVLESGVVHPIAIGKITKSGTTTDGIIILGNRQ